MKFKLRESIEDTESNNFDSEGNPLTREQSEFFKNSKVRDNRGRLLVCYHNSNANFDVFNKSLIKNGTFGNGFYFSTSERNVRRYGGTYTNDYYLNANRILTIPYQYENIIDYVSEKYEKVDSHQKATQIIIDHGYDAIRTEMQWEDDEFDYYIVFEPNQIKSVTNKTPTNSDNINEETLVEVYPNKGESKEDFIKRFMKVTKKEYPDVKQRLAVAYSYWNRRDK